MFTTRMEFLDQFVVPCFILTLKSRIILSLFKFPRSRLLKITIPSKLNDNIASISIIDKIPEILAHSRKIFTLSYLQQIIMWQKTSLLSFQHDFISQLAILNWSRLPGFPIRKLFPNVHPLLRNAIQVQRVVIAHDARHIVLVPVKLLNVIFSTIVYIS